MSDAPQSINGDSTQLLGQRIDECYSFAEHGSTEHFDSAKGKRSLEHFLHLPLKRAGFAEDKAKNPRRYWDDMHAHEKYQYAAYAYCVMAPIENSHPSFGRVHEAL